MIAKEKEKARQKKVSDEYHKLLKTWKPNLEIKMILELIN